VTPPGLPATENEQEMPTLRHQPLLRAVTAVLRASGSSAREAKIVADHLVTANLKGHDSHGVGMIPQYMRHVADGVLRLNRHIKLLRKDGPFLLADGQGGHGQVVANEITTRAIATARRHGIAVAALNNAHHIGRVGAYGERCAAAGLVSLHFVNVAGHGPTVAPFGGRDGRFGTNPICMTAPGNGRRAPIILDFATSKVAVGKIRVARNKAVRVAAGLLLDPRGRPTRDPAVMFAEPKGAVLTFGEHKGYGLALFAELLGAALTAGHTIPPHQPWNLGIRNSMLSILIDPDRISSRRHFAREVDAVVRYVKASPPMQRGRPVLVAGEPERASLAERARRGIPIDATTWSELCAAAEGVGLGRAEFLRLAEG
jgi:uncharacterized oxidoreductase